MGVTPAPSDDAALDALLGAHALDALDDAETAVVEAWLARDPHAAAEAARLRRAASWIGATEALAPPDGLRAAVLERVVRARDADPPLAAYRAESARLDALMRTVPVEAEDRVTFNGLTVRELVAHLAAMETAVAESVGMAPALEAPDEIEARARAFATAFAGRPLGAIRAVWQDAVDVILAWARRGGETARFPWWGVDASRSTALLSRAFEDWTHADDIRRALDRPLEPPAAEVVHAMAGLSVHLLAPGVAARGGPVTGRARVVLTGAGGGDWLVPLAPGSEPTAGADGLAVDVVVRADVVAWCRLVAARVAPDALDVDVQGDEALARSLLVGASAFATL